MGVAAQHPRPGLSHDPVDEAGGRAEAGAKLSYCGLGMEATDPLGAFRLPKDAPRRPQQPPVELTHSGLAALPHRVARSQRRRAGVSRNREDPACHAACPIADVALCGSQTRGEALHRTRENSDAISQQPAVGWVTDGGLDDGRVHPQAAAVHHAPLTRDRDQALQQLLEHRPVQHVRQADQRLGVRDARAIDPTEGPVDEAPPDLSLALVEA